MTFEAPDATTVTARRRLLMIMPDDELRTGLATSLRPAGYLIEPARTGAEALALLERHRIDVILVDEDTPTCTIWPTTAPLSPTVPRCSA